MSRIHKEDVAITAASRFQQRFQGFVKEFLLRGRVFLNGFLRRQRDRRRASPPQPQIFFKN